MIAVHGGNHIANLLTEHMANTAVTLRQHSRDRDSPEIGNVRIRVSKQSMPEHNLSYEN